MAKKLRKNNRKVVGTPFQPGNPGGPGRPKLTQEEKDARKITASKFAALASKFLYMSEDELIYKFNAEETAALDKIVIKTILLAIKHGDTMKLTFLLDRIVGKVRDHVEHSSSDGSINIQFVNPSKEDDS